MSDTKPDAPDARQRRKLLKLLRVYWDIHDPRNPIRADDVIIAYAFDISQRMAKRWIYLVEEFV